VAEILAATFGGKPLCVPSYANKFWTGNQRDNHSLHAISYRPWFKPQLPRFIVQRLTQLGEVVYDPFMGRGTTLLEAALLGRIPFGCDVDPLSILLCRPRFSPPTLDQVSRRLAEIDFADADELPEELLVFYHPKTLREVCALKKYLLGRQATSQLDAIDEWIRMVALNRLTGHSHSFFSVCSMAPNQMFSVQQQLEFNETRRQIPIRKHVAAIIARKTEGLLSDCNDETHRVLTEARARARWLSSPASATKQIASGSVALVVTSAPVPGATDYAEENWLRCWFIGVEAKSLKLTAAKEWEDWRHAMLAVFRELHRVLRAGGYVALDAGGFRNRKLELEYAALPCGVEAGLRPELVLINEQKLNATSRCWGLGDSAMSISTDRLVLFRKPP
jgi:hypothetical protein